MNSQRQRAEGFTLVEMLIVLVVIGLLLSGLLKGQELINNAKVRAIADRQNSLKIAWFAFVDRFSNIPGDYPQADVYITGAPPGDGNGKVEVEESALVLQHLAAAGLLRCPQCTAAGTAPPSAYNSMLNIYGGVMSVWHDTDYYVTRGIVASTRTPRLMIHTGPRIPSNIIAEVGRKIDDGIPNSGAFVFNNYDPTSGSGFIGGSSGVAGLCMRSSANGATAGRLYTNDIQFWRPANSSPPVFQDCGAAAFI